MENRNSKVMAILALIVAVVGLGVGFAAFTSSLTINSSATVTPNESTFEGKVFFVPTASATEASSGTVTGSLGSTAEISADGLTLTITASKFTAPGQTETFTANVYNASPYTAYVESVSLGTINCSSVTGTLAGPACQSLTLTADVARGDSIASLGRDTVTFTVTYPAGKVTDETFTASFTESKINYTTATVTAG